MLKLQKVHLKEVKEKEDIIYFYYLFTTPAHASFLTVPLCRSSDAYLTKIMSEKRQTLINAWEESEKARAENR
jgi:hypothetical protein